MSRPFQTSETLKNLEAAFAGESMANRKYLFFARKARALGNEEIAELFEKTAEQETEHAFAHLELVLSKETNLTVERLLELAEEGERYESLQMYPAFERKALEEGDAASAEEFREQAQESNVHAELFSKAAKRFRALKKVEGIHADRYKTARENLTK
jgi:rubrerythrin